ncbi:unnamed protein product, partial [marine sediment metagenome]
SRNMGFVYEPIEEKEENKETSPSEDVKERGQHKQRTLEWNTPLYPETKLWREGDILEGEVTRIDSVTIKGRDAPFCHLKTEDKEYTVWLGEVLYDYFRKENIDVGDYIGIKYLGMIKGERGFEYRNFEVR